MCSSDLIIRTLFRSGADVNAKVAGGFNAGMTPLLFARTPVAAKVLLDAGADIEASDDSGSTALMYAAREGRLGLFRMLLKAGADTGVRDTLGGTLLTVAADSANKPKMIKELIDVGLEVDARDNDGMIALMMAARWNSPQVVKALLEVGADVNAKLEASTTALTTDVVRHLYEGASRVFDLHRNLVGSCIDSVLDQLFDHRGGALYHLAGGYLIGDRIG